MVYDRCYETLRPCWFGWSTVGPVGVTMTRGTGQGFWPPSPTTCMPASWSKCNRSQNIVIFCITRPQNHEGITDWGQSVRIPYKMYKYHKLSKTKNLKRTFDVIEWLHVTLCECILYAIPYNMYVCIMNVRLFYYIKVKNLWISDVLSLDQHLHHMSPWNNIVPSLEMYLMFCRADQGIDLPEPGQYATGMMFVDKTQVEEVKAVFTQMAEDFQIKVKVIQRSGITGEGQRSLFTKITWKKIKFR